MKTPTPACAWLALMLCAGATAQAQPYSGPDAMKWAPGTGRSLANFAPPLHFDALHLRLEMSIADLREPVLEGRVTLSARAVGAAREVWSLTARETITVAGVRVDGQVASFEHHAPELRVRMPRPVAPGQEVRVEIDYRATNPQGDGVGLVWLTGAPRAGDGDDKPRDAQVFSQGQAEWNSYWVPLPDTPAERLTTELIGTIPAAYQLVSNGELVARTEPAPGGGEGLARWHWRATRHPHAPYLFMVAIGKWDVVDVAPAAPPGRAASLPLPVYGPPGSAARLRVLFARTHEMVALYERLLDMPYPWEKYAQIIVRGFRWGGMENTSASILAEYAASADTDMPGTDAPAPPGPGQLGPHEDLIAHELFHQWMGNLVTCRTWEHLWLNEGWATMGEWLWIEHVQGREAYVRAVRGALAGLSILPTEPSPRGVPMASPLWGDPDDTFTKAEDPYARGALVLHALRMRLGEEAFWAGTRAYLKRHAGRAVETDDFRRALEEASGESLGRFFAEFVRRPGLPRVRVQTRFDAAARALVTTVTQTQPLTADAPAYELWVPVRVTLADGRTLVRRVHTDQREVRDAWPLDEAPAKVEIDPEAEVLGVVE